MLKLERKVGEEILIGENIRLKVTKIDPEREYVRFSHGGREIWLYKRGIMAFQHTVECQITILRFIPSGKAELGFVAPQSVKILRAELRDEPTVAEDVSLLMGH